MTRFCSNTALFRVFAMAGLVQPGLLDKISADKIAIHAGAELKQEMLYGRINDSTKTLINDLAIAGILTKVSPNIYFSVK